jgi:hypothetical protein
MDWSAIVGTIVGASLGICSTLLVSRMQWRHQQDGRWYDIRRETYVDFLTAVNKSYEALWALGLGEYESSLPLLGASREILRSSGVYEARQRVIISAPQSVINACEEVFQRLKEVRDIIGNGHDADSREFKEVDGYYRLGILGLDKAIRADLHVRDPIAESFTFARSTDLLPPPEEAK